MGETSMGMAYFVHAEHWRSCDFACYPSGAVERYEHEWIMLYMKEEVRDEDRLDMGWLHGMILALKSKLAGLTLLLQCCTWVCRCT